MANKREVELKVGRRSADGIIKLSAYPPQLVQLTVSYRGQQAASVLLTQEQLQALRAALAEHIEEVEPARRTPDDPNKETWDQTERRSEDTLRSDAH